MKNWKAIAAAVALCVGISGVALAQDNDDHQSRDRRDQRTWQQKNKDHKNRDRDDRRGNWNREQQYRNNGYYRQSPNGYYGNGQYRDRDHDRDRNNGYYGNSNGYYGPYGNSGYYGGSNQSAQVGYQYGLKAGREDAAGGHSYRPTYHGTYKDGDSAFRSGYMQGYRAGYGQGGYGYNNGQYGAWPWSR